MRILYVIDGLNIGGAEMLLLSLLQAYREHEICVAYFTEGPLYEDVRGAGIPVYRLSARGLKDPRVLPRLLRLMREWQPDVVHTHLFKSDLTGMMAAALAGIPARVSTLHSANPWRKNRLFSRVMRHVIGQVHAIIAVTPEVRDYTIRWSGYPPEKVVVIENGVDLNRFNPATTAPLDRAALWELPENAPVIGAIGRLQPAKGYPILLDAAAIVTQKMPEARLVIIGDGPLRPELEAQRARLGLEQNVLLPGIVRDIPGALVALDVVAFSSLWEGLPVALLEAMAMARPVVATRVGGIPNVLTDGENGLLIPPENPEALADALLRVLGDPALGRHLGRNARESIKECYSAEVMHRRVMELYRSILAQDSTRSEK